MSEERWWRAAAGAAALENAARHDASSPQMKSFIPLSSSARQTHFSLRSPREPKGNEIKCGRIIVLINLRWKLCSDRLRVRLVQLNTCSVGLKESPSSDSVYFFCRSISSSSRSELGGYDFKTATVHNQFHKVLPYSKPVEMLMVHLRNQRNRRNKFWSTILFAHFMFSSTVQTTDGCGYYSSSRPCFHH